MTIRWRIADGPRRGYLGDARAGHFIPGPTDQAVEEVPFPPAGAKPQAAQVLRDSEEQVELDDPLAGGHSGHVGPAAVASDLCHAVVESRFLLEAQQTLGISRGGVLRVPAVGVGDSWEPDHRPASEQDACKEVQIE